MSDPEKATVGADRAHAFTGDVLASPPELRAVIDAQASIIAALPPASLDRPRGRLIGMGSSAFAARDAAARWREAGLDAVAEIASAGGASPPGEDVIAIPISASGRTREVVAAAHRHREGGSFVLAMTADPRSPLAAAADAVVPLRAARAEASGVASLTYRATVSGLLLLEGVAEERLRAAPPALLALLAGCNGWLGAAADALDTGREIHVLGDGEAGGRIEQAALMLREAPRIAALPFDTGDWLHVGLYTLFPGDSVLLLAGSAADEEAVATIHRRGGRVVAVGAVAGAGADAADLHVPVPPAALADPAVRALVEPAVAELIAGELWRRATARTVSEGPAGDRARAGD